MMLPRLSQGQRRVSSLAITVLHRLQYGFGGGAEMSLQALTACCFQGNSDNDVWTCRVSQDKETNKEKC